MFSIVILVSLILYIYISNRFKVTYRFFFLQRIDRTHPENVSNTRTRDAIHRDFRRIDRNEKRYQRLSRYCQTYIVGNRPVGLLLSSKRKN